MAKSLLEVTANYDNPYEAAHQLLQGNPFYNSNDWAKMSREGRLNSYIQLLDDTRLLNKTFDQLSQEYGFDLLSAEHTDERIAAIANELQSDRTNTGYERSEQFFNEETGKYETRKFNMSDYDYTKYLLSQKTAELRAIKDMQEAKERKDSSNGFVRFLADIPGTFGELGLGLMEFTDNTISLFEGIYDGFAAISRGEDFGDGFREAFNTNKWGGADWRIFDNLGWKKSITEWEAAYTDLRDINGNYTNVGKYIGGVAYSLGQALPSMGLNLVTGGIAGSASLAAEVMSKASTLLYFTGLSAGTMHELASDPNFATVPTERLVLNAAVKGTLEWAMTKLTAAAFGASNMDRLTFGWRGGEIGKVGTLAAFQTLAKDYVKEGLEEVLQEFSGYVVDTYMSHLNSEFGNASQWNFQTLCDAFTLGGLSTIGGNIISILKTGVKDFYNKRTKGIYKPTSNIFASWSLDNVMREMSNNYNDIINNKRMSNEEKLAAAGQMYATFRTLASLYGEIGDVRFANAMDMLNQMTTDNEIAAMSNAEKQAVAIMSSLEQLGYDYSQRAKAEADLKKAKITKVNAVITKDIADTDSIKDTVDALNLSDDTKLAITNAVSELFNFDSSIDRVVLTDDGTTVIALNKDLFVPIKYATNADGTILLNTVAEQQLVNNTIASKVLTPSLEAIANIFKKVTGRDNVEMEEVVYNLYFNGTFQQTLLGVANRELYNVIAHLEQSSNAAVFNDVKDKLYIEKIKKAMTQLKVYVTDFLINQQNAEFESLKFLTDKQKARIHELRWSRDLANRIINGDTLSNNDKQLITNRINAMPAKQDVKQEVLKNVFSKNVDTRRSALATMERYYRDVFNSPYNGKTYLPATSIKNQLFNVFLQSLGLKINTLMTPVMEGPLYDSIRQRFTEVTPETTLQYYQEQFEQFSGNNYTFDYKKGKVIINELSPMSVPGFKNVLSNEANISDYNYRVNERTNITIKSGGERLIGKFLNKDLDKVSRANLTIHDVIFNPSLLSKNTQNEIDKMSGGLTPLNAFTYLRGKLLADTGATSIIVTNDGQFVLADVKPMTNVLNNPDVSRFTIDKAPKIQNLVKPEYLQGRLGDITIEFGKDTYYDIGENKIVIDKMAASDPYYFRFAFLHEFQHAIQVENNLNGGLDYNWLRNSNLSKTKRNFIINDIRKHYPELFKNIKRNSEAELDLAQKIIYYQSGEAQAYGLETMRDINDFYPVLVKSDATSTIITTSWGAEWDLNNRRMDLSHHGVELVPLSEYREFYDAYTKHMRDSFTFGDMSYMTYKNMYAKLLRDVPEINAWVRLGNNGNASPRGTIYTSEKVQYENNLKQKLLNAITPDIRKQMFNVWRLKIAPEIDYDTFINMDIPYTRIQTVADESTAPFVSISLGPTSQLDSLGAMFSKVKDRYILTGTVKLKDLIGLIPSQENEGLISPKLLNEISDKWTGEYYNTDANRTYGVYNLQKLGTDETVQIPVGQKMSMVTKFLPLTSNWGDRFNDNYNKDIDKDADKLMKDTESEFDNDSQNGEIHIKKIDVSSPNFNINNYFNDDIIILPSGTSYVSNGIIDGISSLVRYDYDEDHPLRKYIEQGIEIHTEPNDTYDFDFTHDKIISLFGRNEVNATVSNDGRGFATVLIGDIHNITKAQYYDLFRIISNLVTNDYVIDLSGYNPATDERVTYDSFFDYNKILSMFGDGNNHTAILEYINRVLSNNTNLSQKMSMATRPWNKQPGGSRYVSNKEAEKSNLKYFIKKYIPIQLSPAAQEFVKSATDFALLDPELKDMITSGTLTQDKVFEYFRNADDIDDYTFKQINDAFFQNKNIRNFKQLQYMLEQDLGDYYALRAVLKYIYKDGKNIDFIYKQATHGQIQKLIERIKEDPDAKRVFDEIRVRYNEDRGKKPYIRAAMRVAFMKYFDGSIDSVAHVAAMGKLLARSNWLYVGERKEVSTNEKVKGTTKTRGEYIDEELAGEVFDDLADFTDDELIKDISQYRLANLGDEIETRSQYLEKKYYIEQELETWSRSDLEDAAAKIRLDELYGSRVSNEAMGPDSDKLLRPSGKVNANITRIASKIRANLSAKELKLLVQHKSDIFNADGTIKQELRKEGGKLVTREQLLDLEDKLKAIWKDVRDNVYSSKRNVDLSEQLKLTREKLEQEKAKKSTAKGLFNKVLVIDGTSYQVDSTTNAPKVLQQMMDTEFTNFSRTITQFITDPTEIHMKISYDQFMEQNAERLDNLTTTDIQDIIAFYSHAMIHTDLSEANIRKFDSFELFILGYIYKQAMAGVYTLSDTDIQKIKMLMQQTVGKAATVFNSWQSVLKQIDPNKKIIQSIAKRSGIEFDDSDISAVTAAINTKDVNKINLAMEQLYDTGLKKLTKIRDAQSKTTKGKIDQVFTKLQKFQAMMMLSSPGTAIRNITSNFVVNLGDSVSSWLGKATFGALSKVTGKSFHKDGQYVLTGTQTGLKAFVTPGWREVKVKQKDGSYKLVKKRSFVVSGKIKVDTPVARFVKTNFIDNGLINLISEGVSKYDVRKYDTKAKKSGADAITDLVVNSVVTRIFNENQFSTNVLNRLSSGIFKMLSDDPFVNTRAISYFGKMLMEDGTDLSKGITTEVANTFAEAYTRAAWDYMHKVNFFTKMEAALRDKVGGTGFFVYKQLLPFAAASWNWFMEGLNYTPIGLLKGIVQMAKLEDIVTDIENKRANGEKLPSSRFAEYIAKRNIGKGILGSIALGAGMLLWAFGGARIDEKDDKIKLSVGDVTIDISNLFGTQGIFLGIALMNPRKGNAYKAITDVLSTLFEDSTITDLFNTFRYSDSIGEFFAQQPSRMLSMYIPNALKAFNKILYNHNVKYGKGILGQFERLAVQAVPGLAYKWPKKVDIYTGEVQTKYSVPYIIELLNTMSPIKIGSYKVSELEKTMLALGVNKTNLTGKYEDIGQLSEADIEILNTKYGELNNKCLIEFLQNKKKYRVQLDDDTYKELYYKNMSDEQRARVASRIMTDTAKYSKIYVWTSNGGKYYATNSEYAELKKLGITKGVYKKIGKKEGFVK